MKGVDFLQTVRSRCGRSVYAEKELPRKSKRGEYFYLAMIKATEQKPEYFKIGTTKNPYDRMYQHLDSYKTDITICWVSPPYSKYTTLRVEDRMREILQELGYEYQRNDRFILPQDVTEITVKVKKEWHIEIKRFWD